MKTIADYLASQRKAIDEALLIIKSLKLTSEPKITGTSLAQMGIYIDYCCSSIYFTHEHASITSTSFDNNIHIAQLGEMRTELVLPPTHVKYVLDTLNIPHSYTLNLSNFKAEINSSGELEINLNKTGHTLETPMWVLREEYRLRTERYQSLPEASLSLLTDEQRATLDSLFVHLSTTPGLLAYTSSPEKGLRDIQTPIKPGRLLKKLFPSVSDELVREFSKHFSVLEGLTLHSSTEESDFERVYLECENTGSCMAHPASYWGLYVGGKLYHPVRAYAWDSVCVLWVTDSDGQIIGRTVGNKYSKEYVRVYYNDRILNSHNKVKLVLEKEGWTHNEFALECCEIARVEDSKGRIICPYIDGIVGVTVCDNLLIVGGDYHTTASECTLDWEPEPEFPCGNCGSEAGEDYELSIDGELLCQCCVQREYTPAFDLYEGSFVYVPDGDNRTYTLMSDLWVGNHNLIQGGRVVNANKTADVVVLSPEHYDGVKVCSATYDAVVASNGAVLTGDLEQLGLFYNQQSDELCLVDEYRILNNELVYVGPDFMEPVEWQLDFRTKLYLIPVLAYTSY